MPSRDVVSTITTSYQAASVLALADADQNDISSEWKNVTVSNQTNVPISIKNSAKSSVSGTGRIIQPFESFNYLEIKSSQLFVKANANPTGSVVFSFSQ